jgi:hypothetical protein
MPTTRPRDRCSPRAALSALEKRALPWTAGAVRRPRSLLAPGIPIGEGIRSPLRFILTGCVQIALAHRSLDDDYLLAQVAFMTHGVQSLVSTTANVHLSTSQQAAAASGMYVVVAVGPRGWHGGIGTATYFAGLDALFWVDRRDGGRAVLHVVPRTGRRTS